MSIDMNEIAFGFACENKKSNARTTRGGDGRENAGEGCVVRFHSQDCTCFCCAVLGEKVCVWCVKCVFTNIVVNP